MGKKALKIRKAATKKMGHPTKKKKAQHKIKTSVAMKSAAKKSAQIAARRNGPKNRIPTNGLTLQSIWPQEWDVMIRPERLKYVRKMIQPEGCVFCQVAQEGVSPKSLCVYKDEHAMLVLNKYPYNTGHIMVLPIRHCGDLTQLTEEEYLATQALIRKVVAVIQEEYRVAGMNIGLNMGRIAGAGIPEHLHWHIIPRWQGDTNFYPLIADTKVIPEPLEDTYARYKKFWP